MKDFGERLAQFNVSIGSVLAGLLLLGGLRTLIRISRDPIVFGTIRLLDRFVHSKVLKVRQPPTDWTLLGASVAVALIYLVLSILVGARTLKTSGSRA